MPNPDNDHLQVDARDAANKAEGYLLGLLDSVQAELLHEREDITDGVEPRGTSFNLTGAAQEFDRNKDAIRILRSIAKSRFSSVIIDELAELLNYSYTHTQGKFSPIFAFVEKHQTALMKAVYLKAHEEYGGGRGGKIKANEWLVKHVNDCASRALAAGITIPGRQY